MSLVLSYDHIQKNFPTNLMPAPEWKTVVQHSQTLTSIAVDEGCEQLSLYAADVTSSILKLENDGFAEIRKTNGQPTSLAVVSDDRQCVLFVADVAHQSLLHLDVGERALATFVDEYEQVALQGPSSVACHSESGVLYFVDRGPDGAGALFDQGASLFAVAREEGILRCVINKSLCSASVTVLPDKTLFIAEGPTNRIIRATPGVRDVQLTCTVWKQLDGNSGPQGIAYGTVPTELGDMPVIIVLVVDEPSNTAHLLLLDMEAQPLGRVDVPAGSSSRSLAVHGSDVLVIGGESHDAVLSCPLQNMIEME